MLLFFRGVISHASTYACLPVSDSSECLLFNPVSILLILLLKLTIQSLFDMILLVLVIAAIWSLLQLLLLLALYRELPKFKMLLNCIRVILVKIVACCLHIGKFR